MDSKKASYKLFLVRLREAKEALNKKDYDKAFLRWEHAAQYIGSLYLFGEISITSYGNILNKYNPFMVNDNVS